MSNAQRLNQDSGNHEYYTPSEIIGAAREVMGRITLDPASSAQANKTVRADTFYSDNGLDRAWFGRVWMNHPFSRKNNPLWINRLHNAYCQGEIEEGLCITYAATSEAWFQPLLLRRQCFLTPRTNYLLPNGTVKRGVTKGSVVTYFGPKQSLFSSVFRHFGVVK